MITPAYAITATERVLPRMALDFTTGVLDSRVTVTRALNTATAINSSGFIAVVNANLPRFDYDPVTLAPKGLLIEEARTNSATYSEDFSNAAWSNSGLLAFGSGSTVNATAAPDNAITADLITENTSTGAHRVFRPFVLLANTPCSFSFFVKRASGTRNVFVIVQIGADLLYCRVNLSDGSVIQQGVGGTASGLVVLVQPYANGFYRVSISGIVSTTVTNPFCQVYLNNTATADGPTAPSYTGNGTSGVFIWGGQFETGAFATSYIPTTTTSLTRNADVVSMTGTNFSSWFNASAGTLAVSATGYNATTVAQGGVAPAAVSLYAIAATSPYATISIVRRDAATLNSPTGYIISDAGSVGTDIQKNTVSWAGATVNAAIAWNGSTNAAFTANGLTVGTDTSYTLPTSDSLQIGRWGSEALSGYWSGHIRKVSFYPQRLTNAELQAITT